MFPVVFADAACIYIKVVPHIPLALISALMRQSMGDTLSLLQFRTMMRTAPAWQGGEAAAQLVVCNLSENQMLRIIGLRDPVPAFCLSVPYVTVAETFQPLLERLGKIPSSTRDTKVNTEAEIEEAFAVLEGFRHRVISFGQLSRKIDQIDIEQSAVSGHGFRTVQGEEGIDFSFGARTLSGDVLPVLGQVKTELGGLSTNAADQIMTAIDPIGNNLGYTSFVTVLFDIGHSEKEGIRTWVESPNSGGTVVRLHIRVPRFGEILAPKDKLLALLLTHITKSFRRDPALR